MDFSEYRLRGKEMVDFIADYLQNIRDRPVFPSVTPGYMRLLVPDSAPAEGEPWQDIYKDIERVIMPGVTHWQSPHMHAYFPALNSFPSLLGDMLADAIGCLGFTWASSPACTELETIVMDWLGKMIGLPPDFYHSNSETMGGGVIQTTASEATFVSLLAARSETIKKFRAMDSKMSDSEINARLVGYCSDQAHSSVEKAGLIGLVKMRLLQSDDELSLRGETLRKAIEADKEIGLIPFYLCATFGTTGACAFDKLEELGPICEKEDIWIHVDAAYAGSAFICPEFRCFMDGVEFAQSFAFNPSKWLMVHFDCTAMWVKDSRALHRTFNVQPLYLRHENTGTAIDFMHWQVPLSKRFRALKLWFVLRSFGVRGLQDHIRKGVKLAEGFESLVRADDRFELAAKRHLGMVVFRLKGGNGRTELLLRRLNSSGKVHMVPASLKGRYVIRFTVTSQFTRPEDIIRDWNIIQKTATEVLLEVAETEKAAGVAAEEEEAVAAEEEDEDEEEEPEEEDEKAMLRRKRERLRRKDFGLSLILCNVPMSPKFINGSFAALFDSDDIITEYAHHVCNRSSWDLNGCPIRMSPRKSWAEEKKRQCSFDHSLLPPLTPSVGYQDPSAVGSTGPGMALGPSAPRGRPAPGALKQGSLDSKIDEIFQKPISPSLKMMPDIKDDETDPNGEACGCRFCRNGAGPGNGKENDSCGERKNEAGVNGKDGGSREIGN